MFAVALVGVLGWRHTSGGPVLTTVAVGRLPWRVVDAEQGSYFGIDRRIAIPHSLGMLMALGVISFINSWNDFTWQPVIGQSNTIWSVQVDISAFITSQTIFLHKVFMGALMAIVLVVVVFLVLQHFIIEGVKLSGVKGWPQPLASSSIAPRTKRSLKQRARFQVVWGCSCTTRVYLYII